VASVSDRLRAAREQAGLTVEDISVRTKINKTFVIALERGDFHRLPGEFFVRAFLRTYARELGLSADTVVADYDSERAPADAVGVSAPGDPVAPMPQAAPPPAAGPARPPAQRFKAPLTAPVAARPWPAIAIVLIVASIFFVLTRRSQDPSELGAVGTSGTASAPGAPAAPAARPEATKLTVEFRPEAEVWLSATADGKRVVYRLLKPGERVLIEADASVAIRVGNAGALEYSINGAAGKPLGELGAVREAWITRENYSTFLR
jgi:transcriptional regulator with XRE-family HTH domain